MEHACLQKLRVIFSALAVSQALFLVAAYVARSSGAMSGLSDSVMVTALSIAVSIVSVSGISMSFFLYKFKMDAAVQKTDLESKLADYHLACILRWALIEFPSMLSIAAFLFTGNRIFSGVFAVCFLIFMSVRPSREKMKTDLNLSDEDLNP